MDETEKRKMVRGLEAKSQGKKGRLAQGKKKEEKNESATDRGS